MDDYDYVKEGSNVTTIFEKEMYNLNKLNTEVDSRKELLEIFIIKNTQVDLDMLESFYDFVNSLIIERTVKNLLHIQSYIDLLRLLVYFIAKNEDQRRGDVLKKIFYKDSRVYNEAIFALAVIQEEFIISHLITALDSKEEFKVYESSYLFDTLNRSDFILIIERFFHDIAYSEKPFYIKLSKTLRDIIKKLGDFYTNFEKTSSGRYNQFSEDKQKRLGEDKMLLLPFGFLGIPDLLLLNFQEKSLPHLLELIEKGNLSQIQKIRLLFQLYYQPKSERIFLSSLVDFLKEPWQIAGDFPKANLVSSNLFVLLLDRFQIEDVTLLKELLYDEELVVNEVRAIILEHLSQLPIKNLDEILTDRISNDFSPVVKASALHIASHYGTKDYTDLIIDMLDDDAEEVSNAAKRALKIMRKKGKGLLFESQKQKLKKAEDQFKSCPKCKNQVTKSESLCTNCNNKFEMCGICRQNIVNEKEYICKSCDNRFHKDHIEEWYKISRNCYICNAEIKI